MGEYQYLFGPVPSRRFGRSLGIDLTPYKTCSLDCVFCQLGCTTVKTVRRGEYVPTAAVIDELRDWIDGGGQADYLTLAGSGEPTLHAGFGEILAFIKEHCAIPAVLLTNGTLLHDPEVRRAAALADVVKISLSAWDQASYELVNRPHVEADFARLLEGERTFGAGYGGRLWMEVMLMDGLNSAPEDVRRIAALAESIGPELIQLNTVVRPPAEQSARIIERERLLELSGLFTPRAEVIAEYSRKADDGLQVGEETIAAMLERRPCTGRQIADACGMHLNEVSKYLGRLSRSGQIEVQDRDGEKYYLAAHGKTSASGED